MDRSRFGMLVPRKLARAFRRRWAGIGTTNQIAIVVPLVVAAIGGVVAISLSGSGRSASGANARQGARIVVDGLSVDDVKQAQAIDLQVRNAGERIAYVHAVKFKILAMRELPFCPLASPFKSSYTYEVAFPDTTRAPPVIVEKRIDQVIKGDDVDRFRVLLGHPKEDLASALYQSNIELIYNEGRATSPEPVVVQLDGFWQPAGYTIIHDSRYLKCMKKLARNVLAITRLPGERSRSVERLRPEARRLERELPASASDAAR